LSERRAIALLTVGALAGLAAAATGLLAQNRAASVIPDGAVAAVNGTAVRRADYERAVEALAADRRSAVDDATKRHVLDRLVDEELLVQRALELGLARQDRRVRGDLVAALIESVTADADQREPDAAALRAFFDANRDYFARPGRLHVEGVFARSSGDADGAALARARDAAARLRDGVAAADVLEFIAALGNVKIGEIRQGQTRFPLSVRLPDEYRNDPERTANLLIPTASGQRLPLSRLADLRIVEGPSTINREWSKRRIVVQCNARGRDLASLVADVQRRIAGLKLPPGYFVRYGGQFEHLERAGRRLMIVVPLALLLVFLLLYLTYNRAADVLRIFMTLPLSAVGGILALYLRDMPFSISAGVGFVAMSGVSVLGDMVFVSFLRGLLDKGVPLQDAIRQAATTRLRPVLMTGLVASLGFLPMAFNTGVGAEVQRPLATVVIGCVTTSTVLTLLVLPVFYSVLGGRRPSPADTT